MVAKDVFNGCLVVGNPVKDVNVNVKLNNQGNMIC